MTAGDLALVPRSVRDKLDIVGVKLHLREWQLLTIAKRRRLYGQQLPPEKKPNAFAAISKSSFEDEPAASSSHW